MRKLLILDGIEGVPLAKELYTEFCNIGFNTAYYELENLKKINCYALRSGIAKLINRSEKADRFFHLPKLDFNSFKKLINQEQPTHILIVGFVYKYLAPAALAQLKQDKNISLFLYDTDSCNLYSKRREFLFFIDNELPIYDEIFSFSKVTTKFFVETKKLNATFLPFGAAPLTIAAKSNPEINALFVGSGDLRRVFLLENIKDVVTIYGNRWQRNYFLMSEDLKKTVTDKAVWGEQLHGLLVNSKIVININRTHFYGAGTGINLRVFEALAAGAFLLTDYCDELEDLFEIGQEIEVFRSNQELAEKVNYYLEHPEKRLEIAKQGHTKFMKSHTWHTRAIEITTRFK